MKNDPFSYSFRKIAHLSRKTRGRLKTPFRINTQASLTFSGQWGVHRHTWAGEYHFPKTSDGER